MLTQTQQEVRPQAGSENMVRHLFLKKQLAHLGGARIVLNFQQIKNRLQVNFSAASLHQALVERTGLVRFEQVTVQGRFCRFHHLGIGGRTGHHDEHRRVRQQLGTPQVVQQILTRILGVIRKILLAQHEISLLGFQEFTRIPHAPEVRHFAHPKVPKLVDQHTARGWVAVYHQRQGARQVPFGQFGRDIVHASHCTRGVKAGQPQGNCGALSLQQRLQYVLHTPRLVCAKRAGQNLGGILRPGLRRTCVVAAGQQLKLHQPARTEVFGRGR